MRILPRWTWAFASLVVVAAGTLSGGPALAQGDIVQVPPLPAGAETRPVVLSRIVTKLTPGQEVGVVKETGLCIPAQPLFLEAKDYEVLKKLVLERFHIDTTAAGFRSPVDPTSLFQEEAPPGSEFLVAASIETWDRDLCYTYAQLDNYRAVKGRVDLSFEWQIYSVHEKKVIARVRTVGAAEVKRTGLESARTLTERAVAANVRRLIASSEFRGTFIGPARLVSQATLPSRLVPLEYSNRGNGPATVSDAVGGVVTLVSDAGSGSGFLVDGQGYLLTNKHVVGESKFLKVRWPDGIETLGEVVRSAPGRDVALVKTDPRGRTPLRLSMTPPQPGEDVYAIGTPLDAKFQSTVTKGVVSANRVFDGFSYIQSDVAINAGNSGGPLLDKSANVVAIAVAGYEVRGAPVGINLFIPLRDAFDFLALQPQPATAAAQPALAK